jgi:hypothetical protein
MQGSSASETCGATLHKPQLCLINPSWGSGEDKANNDTMQHFMCVANKFLLARSCPPFLRLVLR